MVENRTKEVNVKKKMRDRGNGVQEYVVTKVTKEVIESDFDRNASKDKKTNKVTMNTTLDNKGEVTHMHMEMREKDGKREKFDFSITVPEGTKEKPQVIVEGPKSSAKVNLTKVGPNTYNVSYNPTEPGEYTVVARLNGADIPGTLRKKKIT